MHFYLHCSTIHNSQGLETTKMFINRGMNKEDVTYIQWNTTQL